MWHIQMSAILPVCHTMSYYQCATLCHITSVPYFAILPVCHTMPYYQCATVCHISSVPQYAIYPVCHSMPYYQCATVCHITSVRCCSFFHYLTMVGRPACNNNTILSSQHNAWYVTQVHSTALHLTRGHVTLTLLLSSPHHHHHHLHRQSVPTI